MPQPSPSTDTWTESRIDTLTKMWLEGSSATEIAMTLGGTSRNAVIGKVHRLNLAKRASAAPPKPKRNGNAGKPKANAIVHRVLTRPTPSVEEAIDPGVDVTPLLGGGAAAATLSLNHHTCKWPVGDPLLPDCGFCGRHPDEGSVYCAEHHRRAHQARVA